MSCFLEKNKLSILLLVIIFSPYIYTSVRFDHIALIAISLYLLLKKHDLLPMKIFLLLVSYYFIVVVATFFQIMDGYGLSPISPILDSFEWYLRGAILFLFVSRMKNLGYVEIISLSRVYVFSSVVIGVIAVLQLLGVDGVVNPILSLYETGRSGDRILHTINGRYSSILAQPVSYGIFFLFSISILMFYGEKIISRKLFRYPIFLFVFFVSYLAISKVILIGVPLLILFRVLMILIGRSKFKVEDMLVWVSIILASLYLTADSPIFAAEHLLNSYGSISSIFDVIWNAAYVRFDQSEGQLVTDIKAFKENIFIGIGWANYAAHLGDSGYMPILVRGGIIGFLFYMAYLISIFVFSYRSILSFFGNKHPIVINYLFFIAISFVFAAGTPIFYIDRSSDFLWIISAVFVSMRKENVSMRGHKENAKC